MAKKVPASDWERYGYAMADLADRRGEALSRVWIVIETQVDDPGLANALRIAILGDFIPDVAVYEMDEDDEVTVDE